VYKFPDAFGPAVYLRSKSRTLYIARRGWSYTHTHAFGHERSAHVTPRAKLERVRVHCIENKGKEKERVDDVLSCTEIRRLNLNGAATRRFSLSLFLSLSLSSPLFVSLSLSLSGRRLITVNASRLISANVNASPLTSHGNRETRSVSRPRRIAVCIAREFIFSMFESESQINQKNQRREIERFQYRATLNFVSVSLRKSL